MPLETRTEQVQQNKRDLKQDHFITTTGQGLALSSATRRSVIITASVLLAVILALVLVGVIASHRSAAAADALGAAMQVEQAPIASGATPPEPGVKTYDSLAARAKDANPLFVAAADKYGMTESGRIARYMAGVTYMDEGQTQTAESTLKRVAGGWNKDLAALAKLTLAQLYRQTGRDGEAINLYNQLAAKPTDTVPAASAQIALAELYTSQGKTEQARSIYAKLKDQDKGNKGEPSIASTIAGQKLNPTPTPVAPPQ